MEVAHATAKDIVIPSGWALIATSGTGSEVNRIDILAKTVTNSEPSTYSVSWTGSETVSLSIVVLNNTANAPMRVTDYSVNVVSVADNRIWANTNVLLRQRATLVFWRAWRQHRHNTACKFHRTV